MLRNLATAVSSSTATISNFLSSLSQSQSDTSPLEFVLTSVGWLNPFQGNANGVFSKILINSLLISRAIACEIYKSDLYKEANLQDAEIHGSAKRGCFIIETAIYGDTDYANKFHLSCVYRGNYSTAWAQSDFDQYYSALGDQCFSENNWAFYTDACCVARNWPDNYTLTKTYTNKCDESDQTERLCRLTQLQQFPRSCVDSVFNDFNLTVLTSDAGNSTQNKHLYTTTRKTTNASMSLMTTDSVDAELYKINEREANSSIPLRIVGISIPISLGAVCCAVLFYKARKKNQKTIANIESADVNAASLLNNESLRIDRI